MNPAPERILRRVLSAIRKGRRREGSLDEEVEEAVDRVPDVDPAIVVGVAGIAADQRLA